jgi:hypothetical protein
LFTDRRQSADILDPFFIVLCQGGQMIGFVGRLFMELNLFYKEEIEQEATM